LQLFITKKRACAQISLSCVSFGGSVDGRVAAAAAAGTTAWLVAALLLATASAS
jgi:hypothetical protein